jgi:hypothetical protein
MLPVNLNDLTPADIQGLIDSEIAEGLRFEYKSELPTDQSDDKRKFLYEVAAMANSAGGDIAFGIVDREGPDGQNTGIASKLSGLKFPNVQKVIEPLTNLIRDCITPRLAGVTMQTVSCEDGDVLVIRIPASWNKPHMVTIGKVDKFYMRTAIGKAPMSIDEIRRAFSEQGELREAIARWRAHRVDLIEQKRGPVLLHGEVSMLFHIIPADAFTPGKFTETWRLPGHEKQAVHVVRNNYYQQYNADGFLCHSNRAIVGPPQKNDGYHGYTQLFRSGISEYAFSHFYGPPIDRPNISLIDGMDVEQAMVRCYEDAIGRCQREGRAGIAYIGFSMVGIEDKQIFTTSKVWGPREFGIRQNTFTSPEVMVDLSEQVERPFARTLGPLVDTFWQLDGREGTPFVWEGQWNPFRRYD